MVTRGIILAAGQGTRLSPYTDDKPKCMVEIGDRSILSYTISNFRNNKIEDICVLTGYKSEKINFPNINYVKNEKFATTNMVYTLFCAEHLMNEDLVISYGDIIYEPGVFEMLLASPADISVVLDDNWLDLWKIRTDDPMSDAETLKLDGDRIVEIGDKPKSYSDIQSQYIGLIKCTKAGLEVLKNIYNELKKRPSDEKIIRNRTFSELYMTDLLQLIIDSGSPVNAVRVKGGFLEVDSAFEYETYTAKLKNGELRNICDLDLVPKI